MTEEPGLVSDVIDSIMTPGYTANSVIQVMFYSFYLLFATLAGLAFFSGFNGHVIALLLLSICLYVMIRWFIVEYERMKQEQEANDKSTQQPPTNDQKLAKNPKKSGKQN